MKKGISACGSGRLDDIRGSRIIRQDYTAKSLRGVVGSALGIIRRGPNRDNVNRRTIRYDCNPRPRNGAKPWRHPQPDHPRYCPNDVRFERTREDGICVRSDNDDGFRPESRATRRPKTKERQYDAEGSGTGEQQYF